MLTTLLVSQYDVNEISKIDLALEMDLNLNRIQKNFEICLDC
jgi:hypothetical protein